MATDVLLRTKATPSQVGLKSGARHKNMRNAFAIAFQNQPRISGKKVLLVDDVRTTGGNSLLVVNPSAELLPRRPTVANGSIGSGAALGAAPRARDFSWLFGLVLVALCTEWLLRRRMGLR